MQNPARGQSHQRFAAKTEWYTSWTNVYRRVAASSIVGRSPFQRIDETLLKNVIRRVFDRRATHAVPERLPAPPPELAVSYRREAEPVGVASTIEAGCPIKRGGRHLRHRSYGGQKASTIPRITNGVGFPKGRRHDGPTGLFAHPVRYPRRTSMLNDTVESSWAGHRAIHWRSPDGFACSLWANSGAVIARSPAARR
jgi:hypothetical protein